VDVIVASIDCTWIVTYRLGESEEENRQLLEALEIAQDDLMKNRG
jgi:hypothetical protein